MRRLIAIAAPTMLLAGCLVEEPDSEVGFRPEHPTCPDCTIKTGKYTVGNYAELSSGYSITAARLTHDVEYESHCPAPPASETPPCDRSGAISVLPAVGGQTYVHDLIFATDWDEGDEESAQVEFTLTRSGAADVVYRENVIVLDD